MKAVTTNQKRVALVYDQRSLEDERDWNQKKKNVDVFMLLCNVDRLCELKCIRAAKIKKNTPLFSCRPRNAYMRHQEIWAFTLSHQHIYTPTALSQCFWLGVSGTAINQVTTVKANYSGHMIQKPWLGKKNHLNGPLRDGVRCHQIAGRSTQKLSIW